MAIKKSDLYSSIWALCNELRGSMDASQYKDYVLSILFLKYISDKFDNTNDFAPLVIIPKGSSFKDIIKLKGKSDIGEKINTQIFSPLVEANQRLARSDFPDFDDPNKLGEGEAMVKRLTKLIGIFENPALDFSKNSAEQNDILGDAYEYLMRNFSIESGKSKGQFYTPSEVSKIIAKVVGISPDNSVAATTAYDPTCGSGSLLLKIANEAGKAITLEGQENDATTAGLARMNMILHNFPTANILQGNTLESPKFKDGDKLRTYDYVVANPPFSDKGWSTGLIPEQDLYQRFSWGIPPKRKGDYAYLLHVIRSMKNTGSAACILPHGVLYRGGSEYIIRKKLIESGILKCVIGLPANLFYGTGIPACILVLNKKNTQDQHGIYLIDASKEFIKDGNKNKLRERDIHRIVDAFQNKENIPSYSRLVSYEEIRDSKNDYDLNLIRYIEDLSGEDIHNIDAHLNGGIPDNDIDALDSYWKVFPGIRKILFNSGRKGYSNLKVDLRDVNKTIFSNLEFINFNEKILKVFEEWKNKNVDLLKNFKDKNNPKQLIKLLSEDLLVAFKTSPLINYYNIYQSLMSYWAEVMQDDCYLIVDNGWLNAAKPFEILKVKNSNDELKWPKGIDDHYELEKKKYKSELIPSAIIIKNYCSDVQKKIEILEIQLADIDQELLAIIDENEGDDGLLTDLVEGEGDNRKISSKSIKKRMKEIESDPDYKDELYVLTKCESILDRKASLKNNLKKENDIFNKKINEKYLLLSEDEIKILVVQQKWFVAFQNFIIDELNSVSQSLTQRIRQLAERYDLTLNQIEKELQVNRVKVQDHLKKLGYFQNES